MKLSKKKKTLLGMQHTMAMFGGTILIPLLIGFDPATALFTAGLGTILFHLITKGQVPVFLGSSIAFVPAIQHVSESYGKEYALGGIIAAGLVYMICSLLVLWIGAEKVKKIFPPIVIGPVIAVIGLGLAPIAIDMAKQNWWIAISVIATIIFSSVFLKGFLKLIPVLLGIGVGYILSLSFGIVDTSVFKEATLINSPEFMFPKFKLQAMLTIAPIAFVTMLEHFADLNANGATVGKNYAENPGYHRTLFGDGVAVFVAGLLGGPAVTTYAENTGVLATTKIYDPSILRIAAVFAIFISWCGFFTAFLQSIPSAVLGGASFVLFGMIAAIGFKTVSESNLDLGDNRNIFLISVIMMIGLGGIALPIGELEFSSLSLASFVGIALNLILPQPAQRE